MTNLRLSSNWYEDIDFCPFCGRKLTVIKQNGEIKICEGTFHFLIAPAEEGEGTQEE